MLPTWGPLPCVKTTSWPAATRSVRRDAVASIRRRWAAASDLKGELVPQSLRQEVADQRLALGPADIEGHRRDQVPRLLVLHEDVADLGAAAVRQDDVMAGRDEVREAGCGRLDPASLGRRVRGPARGQHRG